MRAKSSREGRFSALLRSRSSLCRTRCLSNRAGSLALAAPSPIRKRRLRLKRPPRTWNRLQAIQNRKSRTLNQVYANYFDLRCVVGTLEGFGGEVKQRAGDLNQVAGMLSMATTISLRIFHQLLGHDQDPATFCPRFRALLGALHRQPPVRVPNDLLSNANPEI